MKIWMLFILGIMLIVAGCKSRDERLMRVGNLASDSPKKAKEILDSIDRNALNEQDRYFYDLMSIKVADKMFITHTSDSLITEVLDYYSDDKKSEEYLESLYYTGRVYNDLGDYPTAMRFYQEVIDLTEGDKDQCKKEVRANTLSQLIGIYNQLDLNLTGIPYLKELIEIDKNNGDSVNLVEDYRLLGFAYLRTNDLNNARLNFQNAKKLLNKKDNRNRIFEIYLGAIEYRKGNVTEAWKTIRSSVNSVDSTYLTHALTYASFITYDLAKYDSAYYFAKKLITLKDSSNFTNALDVLLQPELSQFSNIDSLRHYAYWYKNLLKNKLKKNEDQKVLLQDTKYNYDIHQRKSEYLEKENKKLYQELSLVLIFVLIGGMVYTYQLLANKKKLIKFYDAFALVHFLQQQQRRALFLQRSKKDDDACNQKFIEISHAAEILIDKSDDIKYLECKKEIPILREELKKELLELNKITPDNYIVPEKISQSVAYSRLRDLIESKGSIKAKDGLWEELEKAVLGESPLFIKKLSILLGGKIKPSDKYIALLIKCGVTPTEMTSLLNKEKGTISYRRTSLGLKGFDIKMSVKTVDKLIRLL